MQADCNGFFILVSLFELLLFRHFSFGVKLKLMSQGDCSSSWWCNGKLSNIIFFEESLKKYLTLHVMKVTCDLCWFIAFGWRGVCCKKLDGDSTLKQLLTKTAIVFFHHHQKCSVMPFVNALDQLTLPCIYFYPMVFHWQNMAFFSLYFCVHLILFWMIWFLHTSICR